MSLIPSGPIQLSRDNQVIEGLSITAPGDAIVGNGFLAPVIRNCLIRHGAGRGIVLNNCPSPTISQIGMVCTSAPRKGKNPSPNWIGIELDASPGAAIDNIRAQDASTAIYVASSPGATLSFIEGHNMRGPLPRGQLVQFNGSDNCTLQDFSVQNDLSIAWTEDNVSVFASLNALLQRGLIDGNNSPSGDGVMFEQGSTGVAQDIDVIRWSNGAFGASGVTGVQYLNCRGRDSYKPCTQGRGQPGSNSLLAASLNGSSGTVYSGIRYFNLVNPTNLIYDANACAQTDLASLDFVPRAPIVAIIPAP